jgi:hypothetical protein
MKLLNIQIEFAHDVGLLLLYVFKQGYSCTLGEAWRPLITAQFYAKEHKGITDSLHCNRLAIDLNLFDENGNYISDGSDKRYKDLGDYWESLDSDNKWGGYFIERGGHINDPDHFERRMPL